MHLGRTTRFPSITLGSNTRESQSYNSNGVMLPADNRPSRVFAKLFLAGSPQEQRRQRQRLAEGRSILDAVGDQTKRLNQRVSGGDRKQLDEYIAGVRGEHHPLSHHGQDPSKIAQLKIIESGILSIFSDLLTQLGQRSEHGERRLLDHTSVLFGSNLGNANAHDPTNLPIILAGGGYKHGRYIAHDKDRNTPLCNLFVTLLQRMGVETDSFATSNGALTVI